MFETKTPNPIQTAVRKKKTEKSVNDFSKEYLNLNFIQFLKGIRLGAFETFTEHCKKHLHFTSDYFVCCIAEIRYSHEKIAYLYNPALLEPILSRIEKVISKKHSLYRISLNNYLSVFIINLRHPGEKDKLKRSLTRIECSESSLTVTLGIGRIREEIQNIWKSYSDAMTVLSQKAPNTSRYQVIDSDKINISYTISYGFDEEKKIINCLKAKDIESLTTLLKEIIARNMAKNLSHKHMNILFSQLFNTGIRFAAELGLDIKKVASEKEQEFFSTDNTEICGYDLKLISLTAFFGRIIQKTQKDMQEHAQAMVLHIVSYVQENYYNGLYLEKVAAHMALSKKYISRIFKERMGISLVDYISMLQIEKSKFLLKNTNKSIDDIGKVVGINNRVTFYRLFRKHEGVSPSAYKKTESY
ncbi:helix-turn-helix domain-containing protein [Marispirochaeta sp.]|uniref:helix-turn-helix domain-containing protein n=1 Tax=Marispirochaeta sp. TaxID=2038653 RepID=UPI0029C98086|nr:helix-turn-helix domain-containing protein [Marispirochaeta sp.]